LAAVCGLLCAAWTDHPAMASVVDINSVAIQQRVFNDFPDSTLVITDNYPFEVKFEETAFGAGGFANRHDALFSNDSGDLSRLFARDESFDISLDVKLDAGSDAPRKEAGLRINSSVGGDGLFIVNTDAHEIVAFGGALPFYSFNANNSLSFNNGDTINMRMIYRAADPGVAGTIEYIVDQGSGPISSGELEFTNLELGVIDESMVGFYAQGAPADPSSDFNIATFTDIIIDDPTLPPGDMDLNGQVDFDDITPFVLGLNNPALYRSNFGLPPSRKGDINQDGRFDFDDIPDFVALLTPTAPAAVGVPEPSTLLLLAGGLLCLMGCQHGQDRPGTHVPVKPTTAATTISAPPSTTVQVDDRPVALQVLDYEQLEQLIASHRGRLVVMDVWSTSCPPCIKEFPGLVRLHHKYGADRLACVSLSIDYEGIGSPQDVEPDVLRFLRRQHATFDNVMASLDSDQMRKKLNIYSIPAVFIYDRAGKLVKRFDSNSGEEFTYQDVEEFLAGLL